MIRVYNYAEEKTMNKYLFLITALIQWLTESHQDRNISLEPQFQIRKYYHFFIKGNGCQLGEGLTYRVIHGELCKNYPSQYEIDAENLIINVTSIEVIKEDDFIKLEEISYLMIGWNNKLYLFEDGAFRFLNKLTKLEIIGNQKLKYLSQNVFSGLINLLVLSLKMNGFTNIFDFSGSLVPQKLPKLKSLDLSENLLHVILDSHFISLNGTVIEKLDISLCGLLLIEPHSLLNFKKLKRINLSGNHFEHNNTLPDLIDSFNKNNIPLKALYLNDLGFGINKPTHLFDIIASTNITIISLSNNQLNTFDSNYFPKMPRLESLDLSSNLLTSIDRNTFNSFPNLQALYLAENKFKKILPAIIMPQLKILDLRSLSGRPGSVTYFNIESNIFINMTNLEVLKLSYNLIESTNKYTFIGLFNLKYLELQNATIYNVEPGTFRYNKKLQYLNLENNPLQAIVLTRECFEGLDELRTLLLGGCNIYNLTAKPSPFYNLNQLTYLALNSNIIYNLSPDLFSPLTQLENLDLANNQLIPWRERLFKHIPLKNLDLSQNKFTFLTRAMLEDFSNVTYLNLEGNPFICDCNLVASLDVNLTNIDVNCSNAGWQETNLQNFILYLQKNPHICSNASSYTTIIIVSSVFLILIIIISISSYLYRFYIRYWLFLTKLTIKRKTKWWNKQKNTIDYKYDAFVSYSCADCYFVNRLVSQLENNEPYLKLCVYERDFKLGSIISEEVLQNVISSKRTLLVLSDSFAKSQWCRWEMRLAQYHQIFFKEDGEGILDDTLVMVKLNDVQKKYVTPTMKYLMKTRIYLCWDPKNETEFWKKLRNTLSAPKILEVENNSFELQ